MGDVAMPKSRSYQSKLIEDLRDPTEAAEYLNAALEEGDRELFLLSLRNVAEAKGGISKLAESTQLNRENLYRMLSEKGNPEFYSLYTLLDALGLHLAVETKKSEPKRAMVPRQDCNVMVLRPRRLVKLVGVKPVSLAAESGLHQTEGFIVETPDGQQMGTLQFDYELGELYVDTTETMPKWKAIDVEIQTKDGKQFSQMASWDKWKKLVLLRGKPIKKEQISQITLQLHED
jgi:probable addiction module antidote protein